MWEPLEILNVFNSITLKQILWKTKTFFKKLEYLFLVENTKIENTTFRNTTTLPEANVKTNRMGSTKLTHHKERSFASNYFIFTKSFFSVKISYKELIWCTNYSGVYIHISRKLWSFIWGCSFHMNILKTTWYVGIYLFKVNKGSTRAMSGKYFLSWQKRHQSNVGMVNASTLLLRNYTSYYRFMFLL